MQIKDTVLIGQVDASTEGLCSLNPGTVRTKSLDVLSASANLTLSFCGLFKTLLVKMKAFSTEIILLLYKLK